MEHQCGPRPWLLAALVILLTFGVLVLFTGCTSDAGAGATEETRMPSAPAIETTLLPTSESSANAGSLAEHRHWEGKARWGEALEVEGGRIVVDAPVLDPDGASIDAGWIVYGCRVTITNIGDTPLRYLPGYFSLDAGRSGSTANPKGVTTAFQPVLAGGQVPPGQSVSGFLYFEIMADDKAPLHLTFLVSWAPGLIGVATWQ